MTPLFELPKNILKENISEYKKVIELYVNKNFRELDNVIVTKKYDGSPQSYFGDEEWNFSAYLDARIVHKKHTVFSSFSDDNLAREMKLICFSWLYISGHHRKGAVIKPTTLLARFSKLSQVYKFIEKNGFSSIGDLSSNIVFLEFRNHLQSQNYQHAQVAAIYNTLTSIQRVSRYLPIKFTIPPDQNSTKFSFELTGKNKEEGSNQFYAMPTRIMEKIYGYCFNIIDEYYPYREAFHELLHDLRENYVEGKRRVDEKIESGIWKWMSKDSYEYRVEVNKHMPSKYKFIIDAHLENTPLGNKLPRDARNLQSAIIELQTVCFITCGALTGMRRSELYCLNSNSFREKEIYGRKYYVLRSEHHKFTQGRGKPAEWVTTKLAGKAIAIAEALSRYMRIQLLEDEDPMSEYNSSCLWLGQGRKSQKPVITQDNNMRKHFRRICQKANSIITQDDLEEFRLINPNREPQKAAENLKVGNIWPLTTHQLRRTFAVFSKRHNLCHDIAIKEQFKHLDLPTTEWYGEGGLASKIKALQIDTELQSFLNDVIQESTTQKIHEWYKGWDSGQLMGHMAGSINKNRISLHKKYKSWDAIEEHVKAGRLTLVGTLHSYCMAGYECQMHKVSSPANCMSCENQLIDKEKAENWNKRYHWVCKQVTDMEAIGSLTSSMYSHFITQIRAAEKVLHKFQIPFTRFEIGNDKYEQIPNYEG
ncbi:integrase [Vibrio diazotrophicus]|uniref:integrase n=1 Tax=Vibrio diazotrophicus TaxID=685 RepID=UPI0022AFCE7D|nr:integrase [Vibrio diazotrophicus]MCZ4373880.1 integrase [Vibrio diazotrophicus]